MIYFSDDGTSAVKTLDAYRSHIGISATIGAMCSGKLTECALQYLDDIQQTATKENRISNTSTTAVKISRKNTLF
jgi:hypothetical protein